MPGKDPDHWLYRFTPDEWLRAAENELAHAAGSLTGRQQRSGVASARRAAGMAWNAVLAAADVLDEQYGRSYMDHLHALTKDATVPEVVRAAARSLVEAPLTQTLVPLGRGDARLADSARAILVHARSLVLPPASA
jgi:HEPN domain-containing protein